MTKAMIFAAGRGERMGELTHRTPKPLLLVNGQPLIVHHIKKLAAIGIKDCLINLCHLADKIPEVLGDGSQFGIRLRYSFEPEKLETAGGVIYALDFFEGQAFILMSGDVLCDYPLENLLKVTNQYPSSLAHLVMVDNPTHHREGDFALQPNGYLSLQGDKLNYAGIGLYHPKLFSGYDIGYRKLADVMQDAIAKQQLTGEYYSGRWLNVDTPERLALAQTLLEGS